MVFYMSLDQPHTVQVLIRPAAGCAQLWVWYCCSYLSQISQLDMYIWRINAPFFLHGYANAHAFYGTFVLINQ